MSNEDKTISISTGDLNTFKPQSSAEEPTIRLGDGPTIQLQTSATSPANPMNPDATLAPSTESGASVNALLTKTNGARYAVDKEIARGGMGAILRAVDADICRAVAMKVMLNANSPDSAARFVNEAKVTGQLEHPNIVPVHELGVDHKAQTYYTMKLVHGVTLRKVLEDLAKNDAATVAAYPLADLLTIFQKSATRWLSRTAKASSTAI